MKILLLLFESPTAPHNPLMLLSKRAKHGSSLSLIA